jgi:hypothetical protein
MDQLKLAAESRKMARPWLLFPFFKMKAQGTIFSI